MVIKKKPIRKTRSVYINGSVYINRTQSVAYFDSSGRGGGEKRNEIIKIYALQRDIRESV